MLLRYYSQFDGQPLIAHVRGQRVRVGSHVDNDIVLKSPFVDVQAIELSRTEGPWQVKSLGLNGCEVAGRRLHPGEAAIWDGKSRIAVFPYVFQLHETAVTVQETVRHLAGQIHDCIKVIHLDMLQQLHLSDGVEEIPQTTEQLLHIERAIESSAAHHGITSRGREQLAAELAGSCVRDEILSLLLDHEPTEVCSVWQAQADWSSLVTAVPDREEELRRWTATCTRQLFENLNNTLVETRIDRVESGFWGVWDQLKGKLSHALREYLALRQIKKQVKDTLFGFGPLEDLLRMPTISEIMVNASDEIFVEKSGVLQSSGRQFVSDEVTQTVIERIVGRVGRRIDTAQPMVDARLPDGSRVNAIIPPLAVKGPCLTVRKFSKQRFSMQTLIEKGSVSPSAVEFLEACVRAKRSILVSGGTGTGKTTLLNCLSQAIPRRERIICIEDTHELQLNHAHVVFMECRDGNNEGKGKVTIQDLLKNALRQRPDRLIVGECRSEEALDMLQAMNTGHDGSLTTIHANTPADSLRRLEVLVRSCGLPPDAVRQQIVSAIDVVVQLVRDSTGQRRVSEIAEVVGYNEQQQKIRLRPIFVSDVHDACGQAGLRPTGCIPSFAVELVNSRQLTLELFLVDPQTGVEGKTQGEDQHRQEDVACTHRH